MPDLTSLQNTVNLDPRVRVVPLDAEIIWRAMSLPVRLEMHDGQIAATGLVLADGGDDVRILTKDRAIVASGLLPIVW